MENMTEPHSMGFLSQSLSSGLTPLRLLWKDDNKETSNTVQCWLSSSHCCLLVQTKWRSQLSMGSLLHATSQMLHRPESKSFVLWCVPAVDAQMRRFPSASSPVSRWQDPQQGYILSPNAAVASSTGPPPLLPPPSSVSLLPFPRSTIFLLILIHDFIVTFLCSRIMQSGTKKAHKLFTDIALCKRFMPNPKNCNNLRGINLFPGCLYLIVHRVSLSKLISEYPV